MSRMARTKRDLVGLRSRKRLSINKKGVMPGGQTDSDVYKGVMPEGRQTPSALNPEYGYELGVPTVRAGLVQQLPPRQLSKRRFGSWRNPQLPIAESHLNYRRLFIIIADLGTHHWCDGWPFLPS
uniref:Uncharacterized protein n=1 Tax=Ananas comosus var. bracteatus TaxID=296719 RepID=A0A6V7NYZ7_ANACO|nr:unnamed protein product [Ananas comosus var. bracteatus]